MRFRDLRSWWREYLLDLNFHASEEVIWFMEIPGILEPTHLNLSNSSVTWEWYGSEKLTSHCWTFLSTSARWEPSCMSCHSTSLLWGSTELINMPVLCKWSSSGQKSGQKTDFHAILIRAVATRKVGFCCCYFIFSNSPFINIRPWVPWSWRYFILFLLINFMKIVCLKQMIRIWFYVSTVKTRV